MECPNCHVNASVSEQQFGALYTCNDCRAVYFINFDGQPEYGDNLETEASAEDNEVTASFNIEPPQLEPLTADPLAGYENAHQQNEVAHENIESGFEGSLEPLIDSANVVDFDNKLEQQFEQPIDPIVATQPIQPETQNFEEPRTDFKQVAKEISDFGNTEVQIASLNYDLTIEGLDTAEIKNLFREAIEDSKFGWEVAEIMGRINKGSIVFEKLNPVKAFILAKRLQFIDVEKKWRQNAIS